MPVDVSSYQNALTAPVNPLDMMGKYQGIANAQAQNALLQQELPLYQARTGVEQESLAQQQIKTKEAQDIQGALGELKNFQDEKGGTNYNAWLPIVATKYPLAAQTAFDIRNKNIGTLSGGTTDEQGNPVARTPESIALSSGVNAAPNGENGQQSPKSASGVFPAGLPADPLKQREYMQSVVDRGTTSQQDVSALKNMYDNVVSHPDDQGTMLGTLKTLLAQRNIDVGGSNDAATILQLTKDHAKQLLVNSDNRSDQELFAKELASANPNDLGPTLKRMIPFLIGNRNMSLSQSQYLNQQAPNGVNPTAIGNARSFLGPRSDTRVYELRWLQQNDPDAFNARIKGLSPIDRASLAHMSKELTAGQELPTEQEPPPQ